MGDNGNGDDENIAYPLAEVYRHTMLRGAGLGSLAATVFGAPFLLYRGARGVLLFKRLGKVSLFGTVSRWLLIWLLCTGLFLFFCANTGAYAGGVRGRQNMGGANHAHRPFT